MVGKMIGSSASPNGSFTSAMTLTKEELTCVPKRYILPPSLRPNGAEYNTCLPIVDLSYLQHPLVRPQIIQEVHLACKKFGFFQVLLVMHCRVVSMSPATAY
uniref:Flavonol synthase/flavanone 3-hydroxylase n=1 Tax=Solanum tuberosum TaxID=4113 RepID=M1CGL3_SOLTU